MPEDSLRPPFFFIICTFKCPKKTFEMARKSFKAVILASSRLLMKTLGSVFFVSKGNLFDI